MIVLDKKITGTESRVFERGATSLRVVECQLNESARCVVLRRPYHPQMRLIQNSIQFRIPPREHERLQISALGCVARQISLSGAACQHISMAGRLQMMSPPWRHFAHETCSSRLQRAYLAEVVRLQSKLNR